MALKTQNDPGSVAIAARNQSVAVTPPTQQGVGYGRALWRASMSWGRPRNAACKVLNAQAGTPAERFYESECLTTLGYVCTQETPSDPLGIFIVRAR
jgi:hypothetical protein